VNEQSSDPRASELHANARPVPDKLGIALRVGLFVVIGWMGVAFLPLLLLPVAGLLATSTLSVFAAAAVANAIVVRIYERGRLSDLGLGWSPTSSGELFTGLALGAGGALAILAVPLVLGIARFAPVPAVEHRGAALAFVSVTLLFGAAGEEMLFHGYAFQLLIRSMGAFATILPAGVVFGLAHAGNQNSTAMGVGNTMLWGVLLGFAFVRTQALWMPIGLHFGWNVILPLFGVNLSGFTMGVTGYALQWRVGAWWSGGDYGPEGGLAATVVAAAIFLLLPKFVPERVAAETFAQEKR
jgi:membrane protease YdiL (CAAX protease family)